MVDDAITSVGAPPTGNELQGHDQEPNSSNYGDKIFFVAIVRNEETLVKYSQFAGNFDDILSQILTKIVKKNGLKMTFNYEDFCFHYIYDNSIIYFCVTKNLFDQQVAFQFLARIKDKFESQYNKRMHTALPFAFQAEFAPLLIFETKRYSENLSFSKLNAVQFKIDETRQILTEDIDRLTDRGEKLHLLVDKTEHMNESAVSFKVNSRNLQRAYYFRYIRLTVMLFFLAIVSAYLLVSLSCGGFEWNKCV